jgi:hypothetical protein
MLEKNENNDVSSLSDDEYIKFKSAYNKYYFDIVNSGREGSTPILKPYPYYENVYKEQIRLDRIKSIKNKINKKQSKWEKVIGKLRLLVN